MRDYDEKEYLKKEIAPLVAELFAKLKIRDIPAYFSCCVASDKEGEQYYTELLSPDIANRQLKEDRFRKYVDINLGFDTIPNGPIEIEVDVSE